MKYCYFNGKIVRKNEICLDPYDSGFLRGYAVFDVMRIYNFKPFLLADHFKRLLDSAKSFNLFLPISERKFKDIISTLIQKNEAKDAVIRTILTGGDVYSNNGKANTFFIFFEDFAPLSKNVYKNGARVITLNFKRQNPKIKHTNYATALASRKKMLKNDALELLYVFNNEIFECSTSNIFIVKNNILITPKDGVLKGITRKTILNLARKNRIKIKEARVTADDLKTADETFLTATNKGIVPIVMVDGRKIGKGKIGKMTARLTRLFNDYVDDFRKRG